MGKGVEAGESCKGIYDENLHAQNSSRHYWLFNRVYCDVEQRCGNIDEWTGIASVNITRGDECPTGWNKSSHDGVSFVDHQVTMVDAILYYSPLKE